jgi:hypothetical protein
LRECQEKKALSLSKKPAIKRLFGTKGKRSSKKRKVGIQESSIESIMEIEFENYDPGDDINDGDAVFILHSAFLPRQAWRKMG